MAINLRLTRWVRSMELECPRNGGGGRAIFPRLIVPARGVNVPMAIARDVRDAFWCYKIYRLQRYWCHRYLRRRIAR